MDEKKNPLRKLGSKFFSQPGIDDLMAMLYNADGFKRESAVRRLGLLGNPLSIPYLIVRANDWVPQVRAAAYDALIRMLRTGNGEAFVASLPQILHLQSCLRGDHRELLQAIHGFLLRDENRSALMTGMESSDDRVARIVTRLLANRELMEPAKLVANGLAHRDVIVRSTVVDLLRKLNPEDFAALAPRALRDAYMPVRREAFQQMLRRTPQLGLAAARDFLFDKSASIREIAVQHLLAAGEPVDEMYANALTGDGGRAAIVGCVLWGWSVLNSRGRIEQVKQLLASSIPAIRRAAFLSIAKLLRTDAGPHLVKGLEDASPAVCNEAARLISRIGAAPGIEALMAIATSMNLAHVEHACCRLARDGNKWDWLRYILGVYGRSASKISQATFSREIDTWETRFNGSYAQPDQRQLNEIVRLLRICRDRLSMRQTELLEFTLRTYGVTP